MMVPSNTAMAFFTRGFPPPHLAATVLHGAAKADKGSRFNPAADPVVRKAFEDEVLRAKGKLKPNGAYAPMTGGRYAAARPPGAVALLPQPTTCLRCDCTVPRCPMARTPLTANR